MNDESTAELRLKVERLLSDNKAKTYAIQRMEVEMQVLRGRLAQLERKAAEAKP